MRARVRRLAAAQDGFTLAEMLVVLAILGIVLAGLTQLFTSGLLAQKDQTNRTRAQQDGILALDKLRREIHCASTITTPSGYPASSVTITLGSYCPTAGGASSVTWCLKDKNGATPPVAGAAPYTLWRYAGALCSGTGTGWASNLVDPASVAAAAGKIFNTSSVPAPLLTPATSGGSLAAGTYFYDVTAVVAGVEVPGVVTPVTVASGLANTITVSWAAYAGATSYNVYGRDSSGLRLLKTVTSGTSYVDTGPTKLTDNPLTLPTPPTTTTINVASTANFNSGANTIVFGASGVVTCTGTTPASFTGCSGGRAGQYPTGMPVYNASSARPPSATLSVSLAVDTTPADAKQRYALNDNIVLRNSRPN